MNILMDSGLIIKWTSSVFTSGGHAVSPKWWFRGLSRDYDYSDPASAKCQSMRSSSFRTACPSRTLNTQRSTPSGTHRCRNRCVTSSGAPRRALIQCQKACLGGESKPKYLKQLFFSSRILWDSGAFVRFRTRVSRLCNVRHPTIFSTISHVVSACSLALKYSLRDPKNNHVWGLLP